MFAWKAKINIFWKNFEWRVPEGDPEWRKNLQKTIDFSPNTHLKLNSFHVLAHCACILYSLPCRLLSISNWHKIPPTFSIPASGYKSKSKFLYVPSMYNIPHPKRKKILSFTLFDFSFAHAEMYALHKKDSLQPRYIWWLWLIVLSGFFFIVFWFERAIVQQLYLILHSRSLFS